MTDNKNLDKQENILTDEEMDQAAGGLVNQVGIVTNPCEGMLGTPDHAKPIEQKPNLFPQNCG